MATLKREFQINENILRTLFLKVDPRIVDALVAHAQSAPVGVPARKTPPPPPSSAASPRPMEDIEVPELDEEV